MKFESSLEKHLRESKTDLEQARREGMKEDERIQGIFDMITNSPCFPKLSARATYVSKIIQPSIADRDLKIACDMMCALASELVLNLVKEGLITIKEVN